MKRLLLALIALPLLWACSKVEDRPAGPVPTLDDIIGTYEGTMSMSLDRQTPVVVEVTKDAIVFERFPAEYLAMSVFPETEYKTIRESLKIAPLELRYKAGVWQSNIIMGIEPREFTFEVSLGEQHHKFTAKIINLGEAAYGGLSKLFTCYIEVRELLMDGVPARSFSPMTFVLKPTSRKAPTAPVS